jgi:hypothetical protein
MSAEKRARAVEYLRAAKGPVTGPVLAEAIGADPAELLDLLAYPVARNLIRCWRLGAVWMWAKSFGVDPGDATDPWPSHQSAAPASDASPSVLVQQGQTKP